MAESPIATPLDAAQPVTRNGVAFSVLPPHAQLTVRGRDHSPALADAVAAALGFAPPATANTVTTGGARCALWLAPGCWRILGGPDDAAPALHVALRDAVPRALAGVVDVSDFYTTIRIGGPEARDVLGDCPLDLHPRTFGPGRCAQSLLARIDMLLHQRDAAPTYDVTVRASHAAYLWSWLTGTPLDSQGMLRAPDNFL